ncbi:cellulase family glycosylhydrolase [Microbulbifer sp. TYP-18]|uniref:cellulase family glycosylhydrolase n=1 Tax=Microbulbifer sp. TYP-18 TaxID=3230024 RepID=UPI0034C5E20A
MKLNFKLLPYFAAGLMVAATCLTAVQANDALPDDDWLHVEGNRIVDRLGNPVWLTGANWFGFNTTERVFHGLWSANLADRMRDLAEHGINILRVPISTELIWEWQNGMAAIPAINTHANPELAGMNGLQIFDETIRLAKHYGVKLMIDAHSAEADNSGHIYPMWYKGSLDSEIFYRTWEWLAERYKDDDTVIAFDIENEPHGKPWADNPYAKWDSSTDVNNWKHACETASKRVLAINPNLLVLCEGIESYPIDGVSWGGGDGNSYHNYWWGGNLRGVVDHPIDLGANQDQLVYSPHIYGPSVFRQPWFEPDFTYQSLMEDAWRDNWFYLHEQGISPLLLGEWGGLLDGAENEKWMGYARDLIVEHQLHHTFWCLNPNSGDTGGLWLNDWTTWDAAKYALLKPALWSDGSGKFVGLDHRVHLGNSNVGTHLGEYYGSTEPAVQISSPVDGAEFVAGDPISVSYSLRNASGVNAYLDGVFQLGHRDGSVTVTAPDQLGAHEISLIALDDADQELPASDTVTIEVVEEPVATPSVAITAPAEGSSFAPGASFTLEYTLENAHGVEVTLDGNSVTATGGDSVALTAPVVDGSYTVDVEARDSNGQPLAASDSVTIAVETPAPSGIVCALDVVDVWSDGFVLNNVNVTNQGSAVSGWTVTLQFSGPVTFTNGWNGVFSVAASGQTVTVSNLEWNGNLQTGQSASFGFQGGHDGSFVPPGCTAN